MSAVVIAIGLSACTADPASRVVVTPTRSATVPLAGWTLVAGGWSFGECGSSCIAHVTFTPEGTVTLTVSDRDGGRASEYAGALTQSGLQRLEASAAIDVGSLEATYGCPDCADGGASELTWVDGGTRFTTTYGFGSPPPQLRDQDRFVTQVITTLRECHEGRFVLFSQPSEGCRAHAQRANDTPT